MYSYPLTFTFPAFSVSPQITAKDAQGTVLFSAARKLISSKEEINVTASGKPLYTIISHENRITDIPSNWNIKSGDDCTLAVIKSDFLTAVDSSKFISQSNVASLVDKKIHGALNLRNAKMYWINNEAGKHIGFVAPDQKSLVAMQLPFAQYIRKMPGIFFRFITPSYYVRLGEETKLFMQKKRTLLLDTYTLETRAAFTEAEEAMLINSVILTLVYERQRLKDMYS